MSRRRTSTSRASPRVHHRCAPRVRSANVHRTRETGFGDRALDALSGCYPNTGYIGLPLAFLAYGPPSSPGATIASALTACVLFGLAIALLEWDLHRGHAFGATVVKVSKSLVRNPIVLAPILASTRSAQCKAVGRSDAPAAARARVAQASRATGHHRAAGRVRLRLERDGCATRRDPERALPTGTGAFMLADLYKRDIEVTSTTIMMSTILSALTLSLCLALLPRIL